MATPGSLAGTAAAGGGSSLAVDAAGLHAMTSAPETDDDIAGYVKALGLPGLIDVHTHFMPRQVLAKVWAYFDAAGERFGTPWPIAYREEEDALVARLRGFGVRAFTAMLYPHKPDMAAWLNAWAVDFAARTPDCLHTATFFPEPEADRYVAEALDAGARVFKAHLQVGGYDPRDPLLVPVWRRLADTGAPVVVHCGSGPYPGAFTGPQPMSDVMAAHPDLTLVVAHMGLPEYAEFAALAERYPRVHLDTTMAFTDFINAYAPCPAEVVETYGRLADRVLLGSDFPNIPYTYGHQLAALDRLGLGDDWLRAVLHDNAAALFGLDGQAP